MKIYDTNNKVLVKSLNLFLTREDAIQLQGYLSDLLSDSRLHHVHINNEDYTNELTVSIYDLADLRNFDDESRAILQQ